MPHKSFPESQFKKYDSRESFEQTEQYEGL